MGWGGRVAHLAFSQKKKKEFGVLILDSSYFYYCFIESPSGEKF